ncbi:MAG: cation-transporting P-type ATPase [Nitrospiraceae bacterium]
MPDLDEPQLHQLAIDEVFKQLGAREGGLPPEEAQQRLRRYGPNVLEERTRYSLIRGFLHQFTHFLAMLLWIAAGIMAIPPRPRTERLMNLPLLLRAKGGVVDPRLRASNEHIPIVRVPRAGGRLGYPSPPSEAVHVTSKVD